MLDGLLADEDYEQWHRVLGEQLARDRMPNQAVFEGVWRVLARGEAGAHAPHMCDELARAQQLFPAGRVRRGWPPVNDPVQAKDERRYRKLFATLLDTLRFKTPNWETPALCQLQFIKLVQRMFRDDLRQHKAANSTEESLFHRFLEGPPGAETMLRHDLLRIAFDLLDQEDPDVDIHVLSHIKSIAHSLLYLLGLVYFGSPEERWGRSWDLIGDLVSSAQALPHARKLEFFQRIPGRRLQREVTARMLEDTFSNAKVDTKHIRLRHEPLSVDKILHYHLRLLPQPKAKRSKSSSLSSFDAEQKGDEELFVVLLYQLISGFFRKDATARLAGDALTDALADFLARTRARNVYLIELSSFLRYHLTALDHLCAKWKALPPP